MLLAAQFVFCTAAAAYDDEDLKTYVEISIDMKKKIYNAGEPLEGEVVVRNTAPATLPASFDVKLYKEGSLRYSSTVFAQVLLPGRTTFDFEKFGVPLLTNEKTLPGTWQLVIHQVNRPHESAQVEFVVQKP